MAIDLTGYDRILLWIKSDRTGTFLQFGIGEAAYSENLFNITISSVDTWEQKTIDISGIADADKDASRYFGFKVIDADVNGFYFKYDDINAFKPETQTFAESGSGVDKPLITKPANFTDLGSGVEQWSVFLLKTFTDTGAGADSLAAVNKILKIVDSGTGLDNLFVNKNLVIIDSGSGLDAFLADKVLKILETGMGTDVFLRDLTAEFSDSGLAVDVFTVRYPYPIGLKRTVIFIRDKK